jgi:hypothetical protein
LPGRQPACPLLLRCAALCRPCRHTQALITFSPSLALVAARLQPANWLTRFPPRPLKLHILLSSRCRWVGYQDTTWEPFSMLDQPLHTYVVAPAVLERCRKAGLR